MRLTVECDPCRATADVEDDRRKEQGPAFARKFERSARVPLDRGRFAVHLDATHRRPGAFAALRCADAQRRRERRQNRTLEVSARDGAADEDLPFGRRWCVRSERRGRSACEDPAVVIGPRVRRVVPEVVRGRRATRHHGDHRQQPDEVLHFPILADGEPVALAR